MAAEPDHLGLLDLRVILTHESVLKSSQPCTGLFFITECFQGLFERVNLERDRSCKQMNVRNPSNVGHKGGHFSFTTGEKYQQKLKKGVSVICKKKKIHPPVFIKKVTFFLQCMHMNE